MDKTNVMRVLDAKKIKYNHYTYSTDLLDGVSVAHALNQDENKVFKTLVTIANNVCYVFVIPVCKTLDLKKAAKAVGVKSLDMLPQKELLVRAGYIHGGCSPIGMKKLYKTVVDISAKNYETIIFSAGKIGYQVELSPSDLLRVIPVEFESVVVE
ncbi:MAG: Cys-tRNA(Pro) deacylase [Clostridia bacterium]|nr:Cys-tRNA(Pro) deacylase [Clostridia bacterium]